MTDKWPDSLDACKLCGTSAREVQYGGRGLCSKCYASERAAGTLHAHVLLRPVSQGTAKDLTKKNRIGDLYACVANLGSSTVAEHLKMPTAEVRRMWLEEIPIPDVTREALHSLAKDVKARKKYSRSMAYSLQAA